MNYTTEWTSNPNPPKIERAEDDMLNVYISADNKIEVGTEYDNDLSGLSFSLVCKFGYEYEGNNYRRYQWGIKGNFINLEIGNTGSGLHKYRALITKGTRFVGTANGCIPERFKIVEKIY